MVIRKLRFLAFLCIVFINIQAAELTTSSASIPIDQLETLLTGINRQNTLILTTALEKQTEQFTKALEAMRPNKKNSIIKFVQNHYILTGSAVVGAALLFYYKNELTDLIERKHTMLRTGIQNLWARIAARFDIIDQQHAATMTALNNIETHLGLHTTPAITADPAHEDETPEDLFPADSGPSYFTQVAQWAQSWKPSWIPF